MALIGAIWLASGIAVTLDRIESGWVRLAYGVAVGGAIVAGGAVIWWRHLRRGAPAAAGPAPYRPPASPPSSERLAQLFRAHGLDAEGGGAIVTERYDPLLTGSLTLALVGLPGVGKSALSRALASELSASAVPARIIEIPSLSSDPRSNGNQVEMAAGCDAVVFTTDQDLRSYEMEVLEALAAYRKPIIVALTKTDRLSPTERHELQTALGDRVAHIQPLPVVVMTMADPTPVTVQMTNAAGQTVEEERKRPRDIIALTEAVHRLRKA